MSEPDELSRLRDHFAAAALTGLLVNANSDIDEETMDTPSDIAYTAYAMADAMLRERCRATADCPVPDNAPTLDAAPAAKAAPSESSVPLGKGHGTGDTQEPVAWAVRTDHFQCGVAEHYETAVRWAEKAAGHIVPLYRAPTLTDDERAAVEWAIFEFGATHPDHGMAAQRAATLRGLLERLK